jgi:2-methylcitrate dehydratase PrpD
MLVSFAMNESLTLAHHIANTRADDIPGDVLTVAKKSLLDAIGVSLAATTLGEGCKPFVDLALAEGGKPESTILGFGARVPATRAAFANGALAHALDFEDAYDGAPVHPNAATIPAALAIAESLGNVSGKQLLAAIILGSDLVCRLGLALKTNPLDDGWYIPPILGAFGATAAASKLLHLNAEQIVDAFSLTLCQATCSAELTRSPRAVVRSVRDAFAAQAGVIAALLARDGVAGFDQPIEGQAGLFNLYARGKYDPFALIQDLGKTFESANVSFKPYPSCRGTHTYIDAVLHILKAHRIDPGAVEEIGVVIQPVNKMLCEPRDQKQNPATAIDAKFSIPFVVATTLVHGQVALDQFFPRALSDARVLALARRVTYRVDAATPAILQIKMCDENFSAQIDFARGHPRNPISADALIQKFFDCAKYAARKISDHHRREIVDLVLNLERVENIGELMARL